MVAKKSSRRTRRNPQKEQSRRDKSVVTSGQDPAEQPIAPPPVEAVAVVAEPGVAEPTTQLPATPVEASIIKAQETRPAHAPNRDIEVAAVTTPSRPLPVRKKQNLTVMVYIIVIAGLLGGFWIRSATKDTVVSEEPSASVQHIEQLLSDSQSTDGDLGKCGSPVPQKASNPQSSGSSLQNVPITGLQSPQLVENQAGQTGDIQAVQPAGCF